jgi:hypothetical protein
MELPVWTKPALWGAAAGAVAIAVVGFSQFGWKTAGSADRLAQDRADTAVVTALVPFCVIKAQQDPDKAVLVRLFAEDSSYARDEMVRKAGWATIGGGTSPDSALADACSEKLHSMKSS